MKLGLGFREQMGGEIGPVQHEFDHQNGIINSWARTEHNDDGSHDAVTAASMSFGGPWLMPDSAAVTASISANTDNLRPYGIDTAIELRITTDASRNLTGIYNSNPKAYRFLLLVNEGANDLVVKHATTSAVPYRFVCPQGNDLTLHAQCSVWLLYEAGTHHYWRVIGV